MQGRTLIIGDIHGAYRALKQALERATLGPSDRLIFLGDYVDGWSESEKVVDYLLQLNRSHPCIFIRGNHDTWCESWLETGRAEQVWLLNGGISTVEAYERLEHNERMRHLEFFNHLHNYYVDETNNLFIHAGFSSMHGPQAEMYSTNYSWDRTLWEMALVMDPRIRKDARSYPNRLKLFNEIFIGHTPTLNYDIEIPMHAINVWNVDTGAGFYGRVTVLDEDTKQFWQSDGVRSLYPGEKGRNRA